MTLFDFVSSSNLAGVSFSLLSGIVIELLLIPHILLISKRKRLYDVPDSRKSHSECIPRLAGVSFLPAFLLSFLPVASFYGGSVRELSFLICGASLIFIMGMKDDLVGMRWSYKFVIQLIAALCMIASGTFIDNLHGLFGFYEIPTLVGYLLTVFLVVYILNAINLIDGVDGLASGLVSIAALVLGIYLYKEHSCHYAALAFSVLGTQIAFLRYNLCSARKLKIFMGDTGSNLLGYIIAFLAIHYAMPGMEGNNNDYAIVIAWSVVFIPVYDALCVVISRWKRKKPLFSPDRSHIHHKLLDLGYSHKKVTTILLLFDLLIIGTNLFLAGKANVNLILLIDLLLGASFYIFLNIKLRVVYSHLNPINKI